jgi:hypothetical protein
MKVISRMSILFFAVLPLVTGCSSGSDSGGATTSEWAVLSAVKTGMDNFDDLMADSDTLGISSIINGNSVHTRFASPSFGSDWDTGGLITDPRNDGTTSNPDVTIRDYMGLMLDADKTRNNGSKFNLFGRFENALSVGCALMTLVPLGSDGYPANTTSPQTLTFTAANVTTLTTSCDMDDAADLAGESIQYTVADSAGSIYDKLITISMSWQGSADQMAIYLKYSGSTIKILSKEVYDTNGGSTLNGFSRTILDVNSSTHAIKAEYFATGDSNQIEFHRGYYTGTSTDEAYMMSYSGIAVNATADNTSNMGVRFVMVGQPEHSSSTVALSFGFDRMGQSGSAPDDYTVYNACVNPNDGSIATDGSLSCTLTGTTVDASTSTVFTDVFNAAHSVGSGVSAADDLQNMYDAADHTIGLSFDDSNFNTVTPADF